MFKNAQNLLIVLVVFLLILTVLLYIENCELRNQLEMITSVWDAYSEFIDDLCK